jgi:hypothetical protein
MYFIVFISVSFFLLHRVCVKSINHVVNCWHFVLCVGWHDVLCIIVSTAVAFW